MRFQSERDQRLAASVISQMISLVETLIQRMQPVQSADDLTASETGRLLLDAVCMQYLALGEAIKQPNKIPALHCIFKPLIKTGQESWASGMYWHTSTSTSIRARFSGSHKRLCRRFC